MFGFTSYVGDKQPVGGVVCVCRGIVRSRDNEVELNLIPFKKAVSRPGVLPV